MKNTYSDPPLKHVWILNHYAVPPGSSGGTRHFDLARHLPEFGWEATIVAASTEHNTGKTRAPGLQDIGGVRFLWLPTPAYSGNGGDRLKNMLAYSWRALRIDLPKPDAVIGSSVHPFAALAGWQLAHKYRVPFFFEVRDLWPETLIDMGRIGRNSPIAFAMRRIEGFLYRRAQKTIALLPEARRYIARFGIAQEQVIYIPNGVDLDRFGPVKPLPENTPFTFMYLGSMGQANGLECLMEAARGADFRLRMIGDGPLKGKLMASAPENVSFETPVAKDCIPSLAAEADAFVMCVRDLPLYRYGISMNKIFDYLAAGRPSVIASSAANNPVMEAGAGLTVHPDDPQALAEALRRLPVLPREKREMMGLVGRRYVEKHHHFRTLAGRLAETLESQRCPYSAA